MIFFIDPLEETIDHRALTPGFFVNLYIYYKALLLVPAAERERSRVCSNPHSSRNFWNCPVNSGVTSHISYSPAEILCIWQASRVGEEGNERRVVEFVREDTTVPLRSSDNSPHLCLVVAEAAKELNIVLEVHIIDEPRVHGFVRIDMASAKHQRCGRLAGPLIYDG